MKKHEAEKLVNDTFTLAYDEERFRLLVHNLFQDYKTLNEKASAGSYIPEAFKDGILSYKRLAKFLDPEGLEVDVLAVKVPSRRTLENARTMQRNFIARYLNGSRGGALKDAALVAFHADDSDDWRFSLVRMDYVLDEEKQKVRKELTPARRFSFLVGKHEKTHTARRQLIPVLQSETETTLTELENAFNIETVTKEFFEKYKALYLSLKDALDQHIKKDRKSRAEFESKAIKTEDFAKRLLGQIVFLYFLQKKGWLGVAIGKEWGTGPKDFLQALYRGEYGEYRNFFNDVLEPLFHKALATERHDNYYDHLKCRIPFLNGGLFEAIRNYDWVNTDILLDDAIFKEIFEIFDLYNFTVREDEPLDKEVAVDPEMLGKVFENLIPENERKGSGTYYTPREIVHYMCQESLINYLDAKLNIERRLVEDRGQQSLLLDGSRTGPLMRNQDIYAPVVPRGDLAEFIQHGDVAQEHDATAQTKMRRENYKGSYQYKIPESVRGHARRIDDALARVKICDPAIGSGAFPVGVMNEIVRARGALTAYLKEEGRTPYDFKRHAIQESIYGVDLEPSAVDIAKLRLWLSLVVDEEDFGTIKPLPNLEYKIRAGDSLLGIDSQGDLLRGQQLGELELLKAEYFSVTSPSRKAEINNHIEGIIRDLTSIHTKTGHEEWDRFDFTIFFSEIFRENGGFDIVIANPPYVGESGNKDLFRRVAKGTSLSRFYLGKMDYFYFFFHLAFDLSNPYGQVAFITTNYFVTATGAVKLRADIKERTQIRKLINFNELKIFKTAKGQHNVVTILSKYRKTPFLTETAVTPLQGEAESIQLDNILYGRCPDTDYAQMESDAVFEGSKNYIRYKVASTDSPLLSLLDKIKNNNGKLSDKCHINQGVVSGCDSVSSKNIKLLHDKNGIQLKDGIFVFDAKRDRDRAFMDLLKSKERALLRNFYKNSDIEHYACNERPTKHLLYAASGLDLIDYPTIHQHLNRFGDIISHSSANAPYLHRPRKERLFCGLKIVAPYRSKTNNFGINNVEWFCRSDVYVITAKPPFDDLHGICGILNSKLVLRWLSHKGKRKGEVLELFPESLSDIPINYGDDTNFAEISAFTSRVLDAIKKHGADSVEVMQLRRKIDQLVYQLYGLTPEEIAIVEEAVQ